MWLSQSEVSLPRALGRAAAKSIDFKSRAAWRNYEDPVCPAVSPTRARVDQPARPPLRELAESATTGLRAAHRAPQTQILATLGLRCE